MNVLTLGELIDLVELKLGRLGPDATARFDFAYFHPHGIHSYRGDYTQLAIGYSNAGSPPLAHEFLSDLKDAAGKVFMGYKGGNYQMNANVGVYVANSNESGSTAIVGVSIDYGLELIIETAHVAGL